MTQWHATVEHDGALDEDQAVALSQAAGDLFVIIAVNTERRRTSLSFGVDASTLRQATDEAWRQRLRITTGHPIGPAVALRIITDDELKAELERPQVPELVDTAAAREILGVNSAQRMAEVEALPGFPQPVATLSGNRRVYAKASVEAFKKRWQRKPGRPRKEPPTSE